MSEALGGLAIEKGERISEYKRRKPRFLQKKVEPTEIGTLVEDGWIERRKVAGGKILFERSKAHDEILENRFWSILYQLGFEELNKGRNFKINVVSEGHIVNKQVDVFAKIGNTVVVAECKSSARRGQRNLQKDIGELGSLQRPIANSLRKHYGAESKLKVIWLMVTNNVNWSNSDKARAAEQGIQIVRERELRYFEEIAKNVGPAAKFQFIGEFLSSQEIPELSNYSVPAIRTKLGGQWAYYFLAAPDRILPIAFVNHRGLRDVEGAPSYQRVLKRSRLKEIGSYLDGGGFFPNCILMNFRQNVRFQRQTSVDDRQISFGNLFLPDRYKSAWIIDGQHRLYGFTESEQLLSKQSIPILAFEKLSTLAEAELFTTINSKQQKVARGLLDELAGELKLDSEDFDERMSAIASRALDIMATETGNPFEDRIKTADLADSDTICLTISELKKAIISSKVLGTKSRNGVIAPGDFSRADTEESRGRSRPTCRGVNKRARLSENSVCGPKRHGIGLLNAALGLRPLKS
ncbi:DGQHR domain-containing protein [Bradyrhizobium sp. Pha-3]|uniref:DGQHR domain-containing protein n=1 Tax=Bradyrhizobium sp. Pha-3 TaxID=208375 RepID=UPI0035D4C198